jgi:thiopeptide-type bacteriocin biosynthesis protein
MSDKAFTKAAMRLPLYGIDFYRNFFRDEENNLKKILSDKVFLNALYLASPQLYYAVINTDEASLFEDNRKARKLRLSLLRYIYRISTRCTPFGLFAGCSVAALGSATRVVMNDIAEYRQHTRLDMQYLFSLVDSIRRHPGIKPHLQYFVNTSLYHLGNAYRYVECSYVNGARKFELVSIAVTPYLTRVIEAVAAADGMHINDIAAGLTGDGVDMNAALAFVNHLVDEQVLVSNLDPGTTGEEMEEYVIRALSAVAAAGGDTPVLQYLQEIKAGTQQIDHTRLGLKMPQYQLLKDKASAFAHPYDERSFIQTDLIPTSQHAVLDQDIVHLLQKGVDIVTRLSGPPSSKRMDKFKAAFEQRYESRIVPLVEALDVEAGIGYGDHMEDSAGDFSMLVSDVLFRPGGNKSEQTILDSRRSAFWSNKITTALVNRSPVIEITDEDMAVFPENRGRLSDTYTVMASLYKDPGDKDVIYFQGVSGQTAPTWVGRFCNGDPEMKEVVEEIVRAEEELHKDKLVAEITHLPAARLGNVLQRPALRKYEIPYLAGSPLPREQRLSINDLMLCVRDGKMIMFSKEHNKQVLLYLTNSHFYSNGTSLPLYHFLCDMQEPEGQTGAVLDLRSMQKFFPHIPRIVYKNMILKRATWLFSKKEFVQLLNIPDNELVAAFGAFAEQHGLPTLFCIAQGDNELVINKDSLYSLQVMINEIKDMEHVAIHEVLFNEYTSPVRNESGERFNNEFLFFFKKESHTPATVPGRKYIRANDPAVQREFMPGSEWIYFNLYTGFKSADKILLKLQPLIQQCMAQQIIDKSFFIRYHDPKFHLRLRFHLTRGTGHDRFYSEFYPVVEALKELKIIWKVSADTYQRELERYGFDTIEYMESIFSYDSMMCMELIRKIEQEGSEDLRWLSGLYAVNGFLDLFGLNLEEKKNYAEYIAGQFAREFGALKENTVVLDAKFRQYKNQIFSFMDNSREGSLEAALKAIVNRRNQAMAPLISDISNREGFHKTLYVDSLIHMSVNRLFRSRQRIYECVIYNLLRKYYTSLLARQPALV